LLEHNELPLKTLSHQAYGYDIKGAVAQGYIGLKVVM
jgi:hypothetical protein